MSGAGATTGGAGRGLYWLVAGGIIAFALMAVSLAFAPLTVRSSGADVFSRSAYGHAAFAALLEQAGYTVRINRQTPVATTGGVALYIALEPRNATDLEAQIAALPPDTPVLVVLPFRVPPVELFGVLVPPMQDFVPLATARSIAQVGVPGVGVERTGPPPAERPTVADLMDWQTIWERRAAAINATVQILVPGDRTVGFEVLVGTADAPVAVRRHSGDRWLLANPDLLANHGIHEPERAAQILGLVNASARLGGAVVIDETLHGYELPPDPWRAMLTPPLLAATLTAMLAAVLLAWAGSVRFGRPRPEPPALAPGARTLIETAASPLSAADHGTAILDRYVDIQAADVARRFEPGVDIASRGAADGWLDELAEARGATHRIGELRPHQRLRAPAILVRARLAHRWTREILNGHR